MMDKYGITPDMKERMDKALRKYKQQQAQNEMLKVNSKQLKYK